MENKYAVLINGKPTLYDDGEVLLFDNYFDAKDFVSYEEQDKRHETQFMNDTYEIVEWKAGE